MIFQKQKVTGFESVDGYINLNRQPWNYVRYKVPWNVEREGGVAICTIQL